MHPIQNLLGGELARAMLIQVLFWAIVNFFNNPIYMDIHAHTCIYVENNDPLSHNCYEQYHATLMQVLES